MIAKQRQCDARFRWKVESLVPESTELSVHLQTSLSFSRPKQNHTVTCKNKSLHVKVPLLFSTRSFALVPRWIPCEQVLVSVTSWSCFDRTMTSVGWWATARSSSEFDPSWGRTDQMISNKINNLKFKCEIHIYISNAFTHSNLHYLSDK